MSDGHERSAERPKVFISYSRYDGSALADELVAGLALAGFEPYLDKHDIEKAVDWEERLGNLILRADSFVFVITPASVASPRCNWEIDRATQLAKRIIPVRWISVSEAEVPERLRRLNYTIFGADQSFARPLTELVSALRQDVDWIRSHTIIGEQAARWKEFGESGTASDILLRGSQLDHARDWIKKRKTDAPSITDLQRAFIAASETAEAARLNAEKQQLTERQQFIQEAELARKRGSVARIVFDALFSPSKIAPLIKFHNNASLRAAVWFWMIFILFQTMLSVSMTTLLGIDATATGADVLGNVFNYSIRILQTAPVASLLFATILYIICSVVWYIGIRCFVPGRALPFLGFLQCLIYPATAIQLLCSPFYLALLFIARNITSGNMQVDQLLSRYPQLSGDPLIKQFCETVNSLACQGYLVQKIYPGYYIFIMLLGLVAQGWMCMSTATIIKGVAGVKRRRTLSGMLLSSIVAIICFFAFLDIMIAWLAESGD